MASDGVLTAQNLFDNDTHVDFQRPLSNGATSAAHSPSPAPSTSSRKLEDSPSEAHTPPQNDEKEKQGTTGKKQKAAPPPIQDISHLPIAREAALSTFETLKDNWYMYNTLGKSREALESMTCDCVYEHGVDDLSDACGPNSDCINRLTQVECLPEDCRCKQHCQNQRFQHKAYANIEIVQTEKKGFGLRAEVDLAKDTFIYEYIGDVVSQPSFMKRMREYANEGIRHFYFMMLQKDEFIDATKRGGIGRFANHSCAPNCYVAKWTIGERVRMGIFAKRKIKQGEELTFNYNVDRYGHEAQTCYCGEPNCVGFIGGKTQTDIVTVDDLYLDALGVSDADRAELKGTRKKKGKKLDDPDFMPTLLPVTVKDVPKVVQAMKQAPTKKYLIKILTRIKMTTNDEPALRQLMRLRGFSVMNNVLSDHAKDDEVISMALECMYGWPLLARNKVDDSKITEPVESFATSENEQIKDLAQKLLDHWATLPTSYRIPKRKKEVEEFEDEEVDTKFQKILWAQQLFDDLTPRPRPVRHHIIEYPSQQRIHFLPRHIRPPTPPPVEVVPQGPSIEEIRRQREENLAAVIQAAQKQAEEVALKKKQEEEEKLAEEEKQRKKQEWKEKERERTKNLTAEEREAEKEAIKEKRLQKLIAQVVSKSMSKYAKDIPRDLFKKYSQELTLVIANKEKSSSMYKENKLDALTPEKVEKIKKFAKPYIQKVLHKLKKKQSGRSNRSRDQDSLTPMDTPSGELSFEVEDMQVDDADDDMDMDVDGSDDEKNSPGPADSVTPATPAVETPSEPMDPRRRPPQAPQDLVANGHERREEAVSGFS